MKNIIQLKIKGIILLGKPSKCPECKHNYFHWDHGGPNGEDYWKCNNCGYLIKG